MNPVANPLLAGVAPPPIAEAQAWIRGRAFPPERPLIDLCQAVPGYPPPEPLIRFMAQALSDPSCHRYTEIAGLPVLREALAADMRQVYRADGVSAHNVLVTAGCNQAFCLTASALARSGDAIVLPTPWYFNYRMWLDMTGVLAQPVRFRPHARGVPDLADIAAAIGPRTRAVALISPNNPTGAVYPPEILDAAFELCRDRGIALILDETYRDFRADDDPPHALFRRPDWERTLVHLYSFSKVFCLTGHRVGAVVGAPSLVDEITKAMDCVAICAPRIGQIAAAHGLLTLGAWRAGNADLMRGRLAALDSALSAQPGGYEVVSAGAYFAYLRHPHSGRASAAVARRLVDRRNLLALPGSMFGPGQEDYLRLAFANVGSEAMDTIAARLADDGADPW